MSIAADGRLEYCSHPQGDNGAMVCDQPPPTDESIDPKVVEALKPSARPDYIPPKRLTFLEQLLQLDPKEQFARCETPYKPAQ